MRETCLHKINMKHKKLCTDLSLGNDYSKQRKLTSKSCKHFCYSAIFRFYGLKRLVSLRALGRCNFVTESLS